MLNKTDEHLMSFVKNGDKRAFGILTNRYLSKALSYTKKLVGNMSEDITQETFFKVWEYAYKFNEDKAKFSTWFYTILNNNCYSLLKKEKSKRENTFQLDEQTLGGNFNVEEILFEKQQKTALIKVIKKLNKREQQAIVLRYYEDLSNQNTAEIMDCSVKAIETLLDRAKKKLKKFIKK